MRSGNIKKNGQDGIFQIGIENEIKGKDRTLYP